MERQGVWTTIISLAVILIVAFFALTPIIISGIWFEAHDESLLYIMLLDQFRDAFLHAIPYPRWLPDLFGGYGYPTFIFFPPGFFFFALPFSFLPGYPLLTMQLTIVFLLFTGGAGAFLLCRELSSDWKTGLFCAVTFLLTPFLYVNLYVAEGISQLTAMLFSPWPIYFLILIKNNTESNRYVPCKVIVALMVSLVMVIISHPATALFYMPVFSIIVIYIGAGLGYKKHFAIPVLMAILFSLILSSPYWFTFFQMKKYANFQSYTRGIHAVESHFVWLHQFFSRKWGFGFSIPGPNDGMSFQLGAIHFTLATIGAILLRKVRIIQISYILYIALILFMTPLARVLWENIELIRPVEFPWRLLSITGILQIICIAGISGLFIGNRQEKKKAFVLLMLILLSALWHSNQFKIKAPIAFEERYALQKNLHYGFFTFMLLNEFTPKTVIKHPERPRERSIPLVQLIGSGDTKPFRRSTKYWINYHITNTAPATVRINQLYFPGWKVVVNGIQIKRKQLEANLTIDGRMQFQLPSTGTHMITAYYEGPPGWIIRNTVIGLLFFCFIIYCFYRRRGISKIPS